MDTFLKGRTALVTGASGGIGSAIAATFASEGAHVILHYYKGRDKAEALARSLTSRAPSGTTIRALPVQADLRKESDVERLFEVAVKEFGCIDTLVANAASWNTPDTLLHDMSLEQWRETIDGVLTNTFLTTRAFMRIAALQKRGNVVFVSSTAAVFGEAGHAEYAAAKAGIAYGLTRSLKNELARLAPHTADYCGGRVNCVCPGWTIVPRHEAKLKDPDVVRKTAATMALPQIARPQDIANLTVFLASDVLARHITGQTIVVAGGMEGRWLWQPEEIDTALA